MYACRWMNRIEALFDGEPVDAAAERHVAACPVCSAHLAQLQRMREGVAVVARRESIQDAQFPAFYQGIQDRIEMPEPRMAHFWTILSLTTAALIVAVTVFTVWAGGPGAVQATEVETVSTELNGAKVETYRSEDGVTTVWVTMSKDHVK